MRPILRRASRLLVVPLLALGSVLLPGRVQALENAKQADAFVDSIGVVTHLAYGDTAYAQFDTAIKPELIKLGVRHIRDGIGQSTDTGLTTANQTFMNRVSTLASNGIRSILILHPDHAAYIADQLGTAIEGVEGPNETDSSKGFSYGGQSFPQSTIDWQNDLYDAIKNQASTASLPVIGPSFMSGGGPSQVGQVPCDYTNIHSYSGSYPEASLDYNVLLTHFTAPPGTPIIATETGYSTYTTTGCVTEAVQAKYITRLYLDHFRRGVARAYNYELVDEWSLSNPNLNNATRESHFGLLRSSAGGSSAPLTEKPAFTALKNLIAILADPGAPFQPGAFGVALNGGASHDKLRHVLLQKRDGSVWLVLWLSVDSSAGSASQAVTLAFDRSVGQVTSFQPSASAVGTVVSSSATTSMTQTVTDDPVILRLGSVGAAPSGTSLSADVAMFGAGEGMFSSLSPFSDVTSLSADWTSSKIGDQANTQSYRAVVKFDLPPLPAGKIVDTATFTFRYRAKGGAPTANLHLVAYHGDQDNVRNDDWSNADGAYDVGDVVTPATAFGTITVGTAQYPALGEAIRDAYAQGQTTISFRFQLASGAFVTGTTADDYYNIGTSKSTVATDRPTLVLNIAPPQTMTFASSGTSDGFLKIAGPNFTTVSDNDAIDPSARVGDDTTNSAYQTFFKFDLSSLPAGAQVTGVRLKYYYISKTGAPTTDVVAESYEPTALALQPADLTANTNATELGTAVGTQSGVGAYTLASVPLNEAVIDTLDQSKTVFGIRFKLANNAYLTGTSGTYDYYVFGTAEHPTVSRRPVLEIDYH